MANYCYNELKIRGDEKELDEFMKKLIDKDKDIDFNAIVPMPEGYGGESDKAGKWYNWCIENWGCKWSPYPDGQDVAQEEGWAELVFSTAWSPPVEFIKHASEQYKKLVFALKYSEDGNCFMGVAKAVDGKLDDNYIEY